jgi:hypothetical protein
MPYQWYPQQLTYQNDCQVSFDPAGNILVVDHALIKENTAAYVPDNIYLTTVLLDNWEQL